MQIKLWEKITSILIYIVPWAAAMPFGRYLFLDFPIFKILLIPSIPILILQKLIPLGNLILFILLFLIVIKNPKASFFLKFNTLQAILINILIIIISFISQILIQPFENSLLLQTFSSTVLISIISILVFSIIKCIQGKEAEIPLISEAVRIQI